MGSSKFDKLCSFKKRPSFDERPSASFSQAQVENWSAFAPDFKELDENVEYEERESEFDLEDEDRSPARDNPEDNDENEEVDVVSVNPNFNYLSSDEDGCDEDNMLLYLPITLEIDESDQLDSLMDTSINPSSDVENIKDEHIKPIDIELENVPKDGELSFSFRFFILLYDMI